MITQKPTKNIKKSKDIIVEGARNGYFRIIKEEVDVTSRTIQKNDIIIRSYTHWIRSYIWLGLAFCRK